jgi:hypothetical protein
VLDEGARNAEAAELFARISRRLGGAADDSLQSAVANTSLPADDPLAAQRSEVAAGVRRSIKVGP